MLSDEAHDGQGPLLHPPVVASLNYLLTLAVSLANGLLRDPGRKVQGEDLTAAVIRELQGHDLWALSSQQEPTRPIGSPRKDGREILDKVTIVHPFS